MTLRGTSTADMLEEQTEVCTSDFQGLRLQELTKHSGAQPKTK
uniref:Uncharacterized protein n=1 Tax=Anguilla anguilla TaxID=7936 RepID=A0A0E9UJI0_ANGAN